MPLERVSQGFKDISATFQTNPLNDDLIAMKNESAIARSVRNIVFTLPGEKFFDEDFGSDISQALFENIDDISANIIQDQIRDSITNYEPRVRLIDVITKPNFDNNQFGNPNFVHFLCLLYISEKICTFHFLSQTGIGPLHCQSYARQSNMGKCHKLVLGLKFWSVYIFKCPLAATALSPFSILYLFIREPVFKGRSLKKKDRSVPMQI